MSKRMMLILAAIVVVVGGGVAWMFLSKPALPKGIAGGNGRLEATEIYVATKYPGRIAQVLFDEGDTVEAGQVVARMDTTALEAQLRQAVAQIREAEDAQRAALANIDVKKANFNYAEKQNLRSRGLVTKGAVSEQEAEIDNAKMLSTKAELVGSQAEAVKAEATIEAAKATADRLRAEINDSVLVAPVRARVETRLAQPGEVLGQGGRVLSIVDLSDVYMYIFLPTETTGKLALGSEARIVFDAVPQYPVRAFVSFVSPMAQFTPKTVETAEERHALTFRVKLQLDRNRLREWEPLVKVGLPGMGYVKTDPKAPWPDKLEAKAAPPKNIWNPTGAVGGPQ
jgi:HlyD family secretion protein